MWVELYGNHYGNHYHTAQNTLESGSCEHFRVCYTCTTISMYICKSTEHMKQQATMKQQISTQYWLQ